MSKPAFLFDLDGTLLDTAGDLVAALNYVRDREGQAPLPLEALRHYASHGARGLLAAGMAAADEARQQQRLRVFLDYYAAHQTVHTQPYSDIERVLNWLDEEHILWGIVTNKVERLTLPLLDSIGWRQRAACIVCGDTTEHSKPHPRPIQFAMAHMNVEPAQVWMIGDDKRDVDAGRSAGCATAVAAWGYLGPDRAAETLGGDVILECPRDIPTLLDSATTLSGIE